MNDACSFSVAARYVRVTPLLLLLQVFPFYLDSSAQQSFEEIAAATGGEAKKLQPGDAESLIHAVSEAALENIGGAAMLEKYRAQYRT